MGLFLTLMYLLSLALGYAAAFDGSARTLWPSLRHSGRRCAGRLALHAPCEKKVLYATASASLLGIGYGFWEYGLFPGAGIGFCFIVASNISRMFLLNKMRSTFHLNIMLKAMTLSQAIYRTSGDTARAKSMECLIEKVRLELYASKLIKSASLVPTYAGNISHMKIAGAKADNYRSGTRAKRGK